MDAGELHGDDAEVSMVVRAWCGRCEQFRYGDV